MSKDVNGVVNQFRYDGQDLIIEMNGNDSITANYTFGPGIDNPLLMHRNSNNYYYVKDGLGSVMGLTDSTGSVVKEYQYSVFGNIVKETGIGILNPFSYTGREYDSETGNYYYRARYYDAGIGRFLSEDPIGFSGGDVNLYRYVGNSPVGFIDAFGLLPGDPYWTVESAGTQAVKDINSTSISQGKEYAGMVYQNPNGTFSYTSPNQGTSDGAPHGNVPAGTTASGLYHTHGSNSNGVYKDEEFSSQDKRNGKTVGGPSFLGTPAGGNSHIKVFYPPDGFSPSGITIDIKTTKSGGACE